MSSRITYHVKKNPMYFSYSKSEIDGIINDGVKTLSADIIFDTLSTEDKANFAATYIHKRLISPKKYYSHTISFEYNEEKNCLMISYAKPCWSDKFNKTFANKLVNNRIDILKKKIDDNNVLAYDSKRNVSYVRTIPVSIYKSIDNYLPRVKKFFKQIKEDFKIYVY